jgi:hypothetical protein
LRWLLGRSPSFALCLSDAGTRGSAHLPAFALRRFQRGDGFSGTTRQPGSEFGNLGVDVPLLFFESKYGGGDDFGGESCWHISFFVTIQVNAFCGCCHRPREGPAKACEGPPSSGMPVLTQPRLW